MPKRPAHRQLVSLAQILLDPFYRTRKGFATLISREWIVMGHPFGSRADVSNIRPKTAPVSQQHVEDPYARGISLTSRPGSPDKARTSLSAGNPQLGSAFPFQQRSSSGQSLLSDAAVGPADTPSPSVPSTPLQPRAALPAAVGQVCQRRIKSQRAAVFMQVSLFQREYKTNEN